MQVLVSSFTSSSDKLGDTTNQAAAASHGGSSSNIKPPAELLSFK
jgi:hypothetical protein